ncbi:unnamed protein product [Trichogramma brassicae]|uniref:C2H2-type domain-containing protein n=1 Tax=Trichogramma brassicae TaxID=86971 RepID=A0A6H5IUT7_9HYME|nr:unnamed protein product [Trichogramma brassicae]
MFFKVNKEINQLVQVDAKDKLGRTPLHLALLCGYEKLVELLLKNGVDPNVANEADDDDDDDDELAQMLSKVSRKKHQTAPQVHVQTKNGDTPLHLAIYSGHVNTIEILLKNGANTNLINKEGWTPLQLAVKKLSLVLVDLLLDHGADLSSFDFPAEYWDYDIEDIDSKFELASGVLATAEHLEKREYRCDSVKIVKLFIKWKILKMSEDHEKHWYDYEEFARDAKKIKVRDGDPSLSLYDLIRPRSEKPAKLLTYKDYFDLASSKKLRNLKRNHEAWADAHLAEEISRRFFLDFARESFMELTRYKLPILCCDIIIERLNQVFVTAEVSRNILASPKFLVDRLSNIPSIERLNHQKLVHEVGKDFVCDKCEKKFGQRSSLHTHQKLVHKGGKDFVCDKCEKEFWRKSHLLIHHKTVHDGHKDFACDLCEKKFGDSSTLIRHKKIVHEGRKDYACDECEKKFGLKQHLLLHQKTVHDGRKDFACDLCEKKFGDSSTLIRHKKGFHERCKDFVCDKCQKKFGHKFDLSRHRMTVHDGRKDFACDKCEKKFGQKSHLLLHQRAVHENRKDFVCDKCEKKFGDSSTLIRHKKIVHEGRKDYACDECEKTFGLKQLLLLHQKTIHEGRKDYACKNCEKKFGVQSSLIRHQRAVHEGRKDYACKNCEKKFGDPSILIKHKKQSMKVAKTTHATSARRTSQTTNGASRRRRAGQKRPDAVESGSGPRTQKLREGAAEKRRRSESRRRAGNDASARHLRERRRQIGQGIFRQLQRNWSRSSAVAGRRARRFGSNASARGPASRSRQTDRSAVESRRGSESGQLGGLRCLARHLPGKVRRRRLGRVTSQERRGRSRDGAVGARRPRQVRRYAAAPGHGPSSPELVRVAAQERRRPKSFERPGIDRAALVYQKGRRRAGAQVLRDLRREACASAGRRPGQLGSNTAAVGRGESEAAPGRRAPGSRRRWLLVPFPAAVTWARDSTVRPAMPN